MKHAPRGPVKASGASGDLISVEHPITAPGLFQPTQPRCTATAKHSQQRCQQPALPGTTVCRYHGGFAPQVQAKAMERLMAMQPKALQTLDKLLGRDEFPTVQLGAVKDVLDRTEGRAVDTMRVTGSDGGPLVVRWKGPRDE